jgi:hypothetical protein
VKQAIAASNGGTSKSEVLAATGLTDAEWNVAINALLADGAVTKTDAARAPATLSTQKLHLLAVPSWGRLG